MNGLKRMGLVFFSGVMLSACGMVGVQGAPEDLAENWSQYITEGSEALGSYGSDTDIDLIVSMGPDMMTDEDHIFVTMHVIGDLEEGHMEQDGYEMYFQGTDAYQLENGSWVHYPEEGPVDYPSWYPNIADALVEIESFIQAEHSDGELKLSYEGNDREVWNAFQEEFALSIDGISPENIVIDLDASLDEETFYLEGLTLDILGEETEGETTLASVSIVIEVDYFDHDEVDLTEVEEEVKAGTGKE